MKKLIILIALAFTSLGYSQAEFEKIAITENFKQNDATRVMVQDSLTKELNWVLKTSLLDAANRNAQSGVVSFNGLSVNADPTKYDIGAGVGYISNPQTGEVKKVTWSAQTAQTTPYLATSVATYVLKDDTGATVMQNSYPTPTQFRTHIYLGKLAHTTFTTILFAVTEPNRSYHVAGDLHDLVNTFGSLNRSGNAISPNGANLQINVSAGETYREGANFTTSTNSPNITTEPAVNATSFRNKFRNGSGGWTAVNTTTVDPNYYDNGSGILQLVPNNKWTIKVVYRFGGTGTIHMDYGQAVYDNLTAADAGISNSVSSDPDTKNFASRIGWILIQQGTTSLLDATKYKFVPADKIGERAASATGTTTMQGAYNNSVTPQITTTIGGGALAIKQGSGSDTDNILVGQNGAGTNTFSVTGGGNITGGTYNGYTPANDVNVIHLSGNETFNGTKTGNNGSGKQVTLLGTNGSLEASTSSTNTTPAIYAFTSNAQPVIKSIISGAGTGDFFNCLGSDALVKSKIDYLGNITGASFIKSGGTSSQFLKADGSVDSNSYALSSGGSGYIQNQNSSAQSAGFKISGLGEFTGVASSANGSVNISSADPTIRFKVSGGTANKSIYEWRAIASGGAFDVMQLRLWNDAQISATQLMEISSTGAATFTSTVTATSLVKSGGTSSQFLKADGSVDSNTYAPLASPALTGTPTAPTATAGDNSTKIATTAYVDSAVSAAAEPYLVYTALISQSGTSAPTATVLRNTLGGTVVWSRVSAGLYYATLSGAFPVNKVAILNNTSTQDSYVYTFRQSSNEVVVLTKDNTITSSDGILNVLSIEIRVYP